MTTFEEASLNCALRPSSLSIEGLPAQLSNWMSVSPQEAPLNKQRGKQKPVGERTSLRLVRH